ncbi:lipopolysaccharide biosynthesis protein [Roseiarcaceae bacterium H3SJ34-1]|uniref:lipopolysaccharide biosynthesis protein n=1 Tax=Terripilifer ovatus TaxID=3032367 RepID=UPI003AB973EE|nr:lipopolysaccharide biosynthesis protein [Roseiarcaceae bacterium H3SJ34-1]
MTAGKTSLNFVASLMSFGVAFLFGIVFTPFLVGHLGVATYGLIPLCFSLLMYLGFLSQSFSQAINRELVAAVAANDKFNRIFSNASFLSLCFGFTLLIFALTGAWFITFLIQVPAGFEDGARHIFIALAMASAMSIIGIPFEAVAFSANALYILSLSQIVQTSLRISVIVILFLCVSPNLLFVAGGILCGAMGGFTTVATSAFRMRPALKISRSDLDASIMVGLARVGSVVMIIQFGTILLNNTDVLLMNLWYGPEASGRYAVAAQWGAVLRGLGLSVASIFTARVMQIYHSGSKAEVGQYIQNSMILIGAFVALPSGFISGVAPQLLSIWLGPGFSNEWSVLVALALPIPISLIFTPPMALLMASNQVFGLGVAMLLAGIFNIVAALATLKFSAAGGVGIALCVAFSIFLKNALYLMPRLNAMATISLISLYRSLMLSVVWTLCSAGISYVVAASLTPHSFIGLIICGMVTSAVYVVLLYVTLPLKLKGLLINEVRRIRLSLGLIWT